MINKLFTFDFIHSRMILMRLFKSTQQSTASFIGRYLVIAKICLNLVFNINSPYIYCTIMNYSIMNKIHNIIENLKHNTL